jgi:hypothetical protein
MPSPSISPSSTRSPSPPTGQIKYLLTNFNFKNFQLQPSCLLLPSLPAFPLFPSLNFLLSLFPSHSQLKIFNFRHFTFKNFTSCQTFNIFTLISTPFPTTLPHFKEFDSKVNTLPLFKLLDLFTFISPFHTQCQNPFYPLTSNWAFHTFLQGCPIQTTEL